MKKRDIIDEILRLNPTARPEFLSRFRESDLLDYLRQLRSLGLLPQCDHRPRRQACPAGA